MKNRHYYPLIRSLKGIHKLVFRQLRFTRYLWIIGGLLFVAIYIIGDYGIIQIYFKIREVRSLQSEIMSLETEHKILKEQKALLEAGDPVFLEKIAREKFRMVRDGEVLYKIIMEKEHETSPKEGKSLSEQNDKKNP